MRARLSAAAIAAVITVLAGPPAGAQQQYDLIIRGGRVLDGTGGAERVADVAITGGRIARIGNLRNARATRVIDATGKYVTPGFIDMHSHADWAYGTREGNVALNNLTQGITTVVVGQDGRSAWRVGETIREPIALLRREGIAENAILLIGQGSVRREVMGDTNRAATPEEITRMRALVRDAMQAGAWGISTGLGYVPGRFATTEEVIAVTKEVAPFGGFYISHLRFQNDRLMESVEETIRISRETGVPVVLSHFKSSGARNFGKARAAMERIKAARDSGVKAWVDVYPWATSSDGINIDLVPDPPPQFRPELWNPALDTLLANATNGQLAALVLAGQPFIRMTTTEQWLRSRPRDELVETARRALYGAARERNTTARREIFLAELADSVRGKAMRDAIRRRLEATNGGELNVIEDAPDDRLDGKTLAQAAAILGVDLVEAAIQVDLMGAAVTNYHMSEPDVEAILSFNSFTALSTDGTVPPFGVGETHPRSYGTYPRLFGHYVKNRKVLTWPQAVRASSGLAADMIGLTDRGYLKEGQAADVVVMDPNTIGECATYAKPHCYSKGIDYLIVNGVLTLDGGKYTGAKAGQVLTRSRATASR